MAAKRRYVIVPCPYCKQLQVAPGNAKTKTCPYCGRRFKLREARIVAWSDDPRDASELVRRLKEQGYGLEKFMG